MKNILRARARLGEGPCWDATNQHLYWVDIFNHCVHQYDPVSNENRFFEVGEVVGCAAPAQNNRLILAQRKHIAFLNIEDGTVTPIMDFPFEPDERFNDGKCDAAGRFWFGSMSNSTPKAGLYRYDPDGSLHQLETGLTISNGLGWSPDNKTFYLTDSPLKIIYAYDFDNESGSIANRRVFINLSEESFFPDGMTVDSEGCIWSAMWDGWCVIRFDPTGKEMKRIRVPVKLPTSCAFGGSDLKTLFITTASVGLSQEEIQESFLSGDLFALQTDTVGLPANHFAG